MTRDCVFCKIVAGTIPSQTLYRDEHVTAFHDVNPQAPVHVLIVPNQHVESLATAGPEDTTILGHILAIAPRIAAETGIANSGYRVVLNTGRDAGMAVYHLHAHVLGGRQMAWPPG
jgi:histidine triad (HIT) family protein